MTIKKFLLLLLLPSAVAAQYSISPLVTGLNNPIAFERTPDNRIFITLKEGLVQAYDTGGAFIQTMYDISDSTLDYGECGMLGLCLDPQFPVNHFVYVYYNHFDSNGTSTQARMRVLRLTENNNLLTGPLLILDIPQLGNNHLGGNIHFPHAVSNMLFVSIGDNTSQADAQLTDNPYGKILRIHPDGTIPTDNPFYDDGNPAAGNDDRIWAYGLRNSFDFAFSPLNDSLYATENGPSQDDEVNMIHPGKNYGWPVVTGIANNPLFEDPLYTWTPTVAPTGILFYADTVFPQFNRHILVDIFNNGYVYDLSTGNTPVYDTITGCSLVFNFGSGFANYLTAIHAGPDGFLYVMHGGPSGILYRISPGAGGVENHEPDRLQVSPVPASDWVTITGMNANRDQVTFTLYETEGREVMREVRKLHPGVPLHESIRISGLKPGFYILQTILSGPMGQEVSDRKMVIMR